LPFSIYASSAICAAGKGGPDARPALADFHALRLSTVPVAPIKEGLAVGRMVTSGNALLEPAKTLLQGTVHPIYLHISTLAEGLFFVLGERVMSSSVLAELDFIEELRLRRWARENYVPPGERKHTWHPVIHEEMDKKDHEAGTSTPAYAWSER
jgi:hypothetical protein